MKVYFLFFFLILASCVETTEKQDPSTSLLPKGMTVTVSNAQVEQKQELRENSDLVSKCEVKLMKCDGSYNPVKKMAINSNKPKVFVLWATWCHFCKPLLNDYSNLKKSYPNIDFFTLASDKKTQLIEVKKALAKYGLLSGNFIMGSENDGSMDPRNETSTEQFMKCIGVDFPGYPTTFIINENGKVVFEMAGYEDSTKLLLTKQLETMNKK